MSDQRRPFTMAASVFTREFDGELVVLDLAGGEYYGLNEVGAKIWQHLVEGKSVEQVAVEIASEFEVDQAAALGEINRLSILLGLTTTVAAASLAPRSEAKSQTTVDALKSRAWTVISMIERLEAHFPVRVESRAVADFQ